MTVMRKAGIAAVVLFTIFAIGCGQTFRRIAIPEPQPGGDPQALKHAIVVNQNGGSLGSTTNVDISGDSNVGNTIVGVGPVHAGFLGTARTYVANAAENSVSRYFTLQPQSSVVTIPMPAGCSPQQVFTRSSSFMYVACAGNGSVAVISTAPDAVTAEVLGVGASPVALSGTPNGAKIYAANSGDGTVRVINTVDNTLGASIAVGGAPVWMDINLEGTYLFVANASGWVDIINTTTDAVVGTVAVGTSPNFLIYDPSLKRAYVTNPADGTVSIVDANPASPTFPTTPAVSVAVGADPRSVAPLRNGAKFYVANYGSGTVTVYSTTNNGLLKTIPVGTGPISLAAAPDSSKVTAGVQGTGVLADPATIAQIRTSDDTVVVFISPPQQVATCDPALVYCPKQIPVFVTLAP